MRVQWYQITRRGWQGVGLTGGAAILLCEHMVFWHPAFKGRNPL